MDNTEYALKLFDKGFNCSQAVFMTAARADSLGEDLAGKISMPFGGGIARNGDMCGAVTGALMALGLRHGAAETSAELKKNMYACCNDFMTEFRKRCGSLTCRELIGCDLSTEEGRKTAAERNVHVSICRNLIGTAMALLSGE